MIDQTALVPAYVAAGTALLAILVDLIAPGRRGPVLTVTMLGALATAYVSWWTFSGGVRGSFCNQDGCSLVWDRWAMLVGVVFALVTAAVAGLSVSVLRTGSVPAGEYGFLLACSMTGGVVLGASRDLITLIVALETLTLPLYSLVALRRRVLASAEAAITFLIVSVVSTAVTLLGAALVYASTGSVYFGQIASALTYRQELRQIPMVGLAVVLILVGLAFKVAAVPFHAWAPATYDGAPLPIAAYLSTASKFGGVIALLFVSVGALGPWLNVAGPALAALAVLTMTVGNLAALRQQRMVRLLAWSSVAQAGYILAPLGVFALAAGRNTVTANAAVAATLAYAVFYIALEVVAFGCVIALRGGADGGTLADYRGAAQRRPWVTGAFVVALTGLAGLPPGLAGLFAKATVVRSLLNGSAGWLAVLVGLNAVIGLAYYLRAVVALFARAEGTTEASSDGAVPGDGARLPVLVGVVLAIATLVVAVVSFAPQLVLDAVAAR